jgi:hypothetical protein
MYKDPISACPEKVKMIVFGGKYKITQAVCVNVIDTEKNNTCP